MTLVINGVESEGLMDFGGFRGQSTLTTVSNSTLVLTASSTYYQFFTGSVVGQLINLPDATTLNNGHTFWFWNGATSPINVRDFNGTQLGLINPNFRVTAVLRSNTTPAGDWIVSVTTGSSFSGVSGIIGYFNGNANVGRYLEFFPGISSDVGPYFLPTNIYIVALTFSAISNSTGTIGLFDTTNLVTPLVSLSLTASRNAFTTTLAVPVLQGRSIAARITSGSINKPYIVWYITGG